jgi:tetratricopeptide (TPR) repeat protein
MNEEKDRFYRESGIVEVVRRYEEMISNNTRYYFDVDEFEEIIDHYLNLAKFNRALKAVQHATIQHPSSTVIQLKKSVILNEKAQPREALRILKTIEKIELSNPEVFFTKGISLNLLGNTRDAIKQFNKAILLTGEGKADIMSNAAMAFEQQNQFGAALIYLLQAYELEPENLSYIYDIAYCYERDDKLDKALDFYNKFLDIDPFSENVWYNMGVVYNRMENFEKAIECYDFAIALDEEYSSAYFNKANTLANSGDQSEAIEIYKELLYLEENNEQVLCYIGECYEKIEKWDDAQEYYLKTLKINPDFSDAWLGLGMVKFSREEYTESLEHVRKAINYTPDNPEYWYSLGNIYVKLNRLEEATNAYRTAVDFDPQDFDSWINLAETFMNLHKNNNAITILEEASVINPGVALFNYRLAAYHLMNKEGERADYHLRIALSLDYELHKEFFAYYPRASRLAAVKRLLLEFQKAT